ncbi:MAG TPA: DsbA family protein [Bryobacteraceae bacterium]
MHLSTRGLHPGIVQDNSTNGVLRNAADSELAVSRLLLPIQPEDHVEGSPNARYTLVEYGDYECPGCGALFVTIRRLHEQFGEQVRLVFRHYPLSGIHPHAQKAAEAAEAAAAQNRFWEMHDLLFEHQDALRARELYRYSEQLGLDTKRFRSELKAHVWEDRVREDFRRGVANGVYGTPGLFINGIRYNGGLDLASILNELKAKS